MLLLLLLLLLFLLLLFDQPCCSGHVPLGSEGPLLTEGLGSVLAQRAVLLGLDGNKSSTNTQLDQTPETAVPRVMVPNNFFCPLVMTR